MEFLPVRKRRPCSKFADRIPWNSEFEIASGPFTSNLFRCFTTPPAGKAPGEKSESVMETAIGINLTWESVLGTPRMTVACWLALLEFCGQEGYTADPDRFGPQRG
jgi:hypothetical protein